MARGSGKKCFLVAERPFLYLNVLSGNKHTLFYLNALSFHLNVLSLLYYIFNILLYSDSPLLKTKNLSPIVLQLIGRTKDKYILD